MNTKEAIEFLARKIDNADKCERVNVYFHKSKADEIIELLKRGEKFEKMWKLLKNKSGFRKIEHVFTEFQCTIEEIMESYEQKYFPKGDD